MRVLNFGSLNIDYVYSVSHIAAPGETIASSGRHVYYGGKGFNQSVALSQAGVPVCHAGMVGADGGELLSECEKYGVDSRFIEKSPGETGHTFIQVDAQGQNSIVLFGGSNQSVSREHVDRVLAQFGAGDLLVLQNEINGLGYIIRQAAARGMAVILNPSPCDEAVLDCGLSQVRWLVLNEVEGRQITGEQEGGAILQALAQRFPQTGAVLTLGSEGAFCQDGGQVLYQPCFQVEPVDTTAAGDTFLGYFTAGLAQSLPLKQAMERAAAAAAIAITRPGAAPSVPSYKEVERFLAERARASSPNSGAGA